VYTLLVNPSGAVTVIKTSVIPTGVKIVPEAVPLVTTAPLTLIVLPAGVVPTSGVNVMLKVPLGIRRL
jgi:hypothetical protein